MKKNIIKLILILILFSLLFSFSSTYITSAFLLYDTNMKIRGEITGGGGISYTTEANFFSLGFSEVAPFYPYQRAICRDGQNYIHIVWLYNSTAVKYARSTDNGNSWQITTWGNETASALNYPHISCDGNNITVVYSNTSL
ncbi:MAG: hypothetical protein QW076_01685, partial [Candidatus Anstonellales archaeon]